MANALHPDIVLANAQPDLPRGYSIIDPPDLPPEWDQNNNLIVSFWSDVCGDYTARLNQNNDGFDVRRVNNDDPTGMGRRFDGDWPMNFPLGPPSNLPDYHPLLEKWGLKILNAGGFINDKQPHESMTHGPIGRLHFDPWRNPQHDPNERIHPILRMDMFRSISQQQYNLISPALNLATAILDDPVTLNYYYGLSVPASLMSTIYDPKLAEFCRIMDVPSSLTAEQQRETFGKICALRNWTSFDFKSGESNNWAFYGATATIKDGTGGFIDAARPNTRRTTIYLSDVYLKILARNITNWNSGENYYHELQRMAGIPASKREHISLPSAHYRATLFLADTILHELTHAFCNAYFEWQPPHTQPREPWPQGTRCNEQGSCFEQHIFGGNPVGYDIPVPPISHEYLLSTAMAAPFGAWFEENWDQWMVNNAAYTHSTLESIKAAEYNSPRRYYPILQEWFTRLFTDDLWVDQVQRFGLSAIAIPKPVDWQVMVWRPHWNRGIWGTGEERWNVGSYIAKTHNWI